MSTMKTLTINGVKYDVTPVVPATSVTLLERAWVDEGEGHSQVVEIPGVTPSTKVDLQPTAEQLVEFHDKILAFVAENDGGVVTVYAIGHRPTGDHTIQTTLTEVEGTGKIRGNTVGTTMPNPDWNQTDPTKADYIKNKPTYAELGAAPSGYGLGTTATDISNQNLVTATAEKSGFFRGNNVTHAPDADWWRYFINAGASNSVLFATHYDGRCYYASIDNNATSVKWIKLYTTDSKPTAEEIGAAPSGYGLGVAGTKVLKGTDDLNTVLQNGWYYWGTNPPANAPVLVDGGESVYQLMRVTASGENDGIQEYWSFAGGYDLQIQTRRIKRNGVWGPLEYYNPQMTPGIEYRTTERWNGKPVYKKTISLGKLPESTTKFENLLIADEVIDFSFTTTDNLTEKFIHNNKVTALGRAYSSQYIYATIELNSVLSQYYGYLTISYTKL